MEEADKTPPPANPPKPIPVAIQRLMDEVRNEGVLPHCVFDRAHNRHNRS